MNILVLYHILECQTPMKDEAKIGSNSVTGEWHGIQLFNTLTIGKSLVLQTSSNL